MSATVQEARTTHDAECSCRECQPTTRHVIATLTARDGDSPFSWDPSDPDEVNAARQHFANLCRTHVMYAIGEGDDRTQIREFDPSRRRILAVPQLQGG